MQLALISLVFLNVLQLAIWAPGLWRWHKYSAALLILPFSVTSGFLIADYFSGWAVVMAVLCVYQMINLLRLIEDRIHNDYLYHASLRTALSLAIGEAGIYLLGKLINYNHASFTTWLYVLALFQLMISSILLLSTLRNLRTTKPPVIEESYTSKELPTVTVAIPARNETTDLEECLQSLLASDYPKLEILVLDDCSQNAKTPEIIRGFAHDGVRFIAGSVPPEQWLAKNYAYQQLAEEANGQLIMFCGVDTRFAPQTVSRLVKTLLHKKKTMLCVVPKNVLSSFRQLLVQPSRYAWELSLPRRFINRPPVLSTCWLIERQALVAAGGFGAVTRQSVPESYLARQVAQHDGYTLICADASVGLTSVKSFTEQLDTAVRTRYPQLHRRPETAALISLTQFFGLAWPLIMVILAVMNGLWQIVAVSLLAFLIATLHFSLIVNLTYRRFVSSGLWLMIFAVLYDIGLLNYSMWQYEFGTVDWKGRNVCIPVMRVMSELPKI